MRYTYKIVLLKRIRLFKVVTNDIHKSVSLNGKGLRLIGCFRYSHNNVKRIKLVCSDLQRTSNVIAEVFL